MEKVCEQLAHGLPEIPVEEMISKECPVNFAGKVLEYSRENLCGRSTYCRDGIAQLYCIVCDIQNGKAKTTDIELMNEICRMMALSGDCELSVETAKLIQRLLTDYTEEWQAHITRSKCSALRCRNCYTVHILPESCDGCSICLPECSSGAILGKEGYIHLIDQDKCDCCGKCEVLCRKGAIVRAGMRKPRGIETPVPVGSFSEDGSGGMRRRRRHGSHSEE